MAGGLDVTFSVLKKTPNEAAVRVLLGGLDVPNCVVQVGALRGLLARRGATGLHELIRRWHTFSTRGRSIIADSGRRLSSALRDAVLSSDEHLYRNGCAATLTLREYDLFSCLLAVAEETSSPRTELAAETLLQLADSLCAELAAPRDYRNRRDPQVVRRHVVGILERSVERFGRHKCREIVEAFLMLAGCDNPTLNHVFQDPHDDAHETVVQLLSHSARPSVIRLILDLFNNPRVPAAIFSIVTRRQDASFVRSMLNRFVGKVPKTARRNLKRIELFSWLQDDMNLLATLTGEEQRGVIHLIMASGMSHLRMFEAVDFILTHGATEGRREAATVLSRFQNPDASMAVMRALEDEDSVVRTIAASQLIRGGMSSSGSPPMLNPGEAIS